MPALPASPGKSHSFRLNTKYSTTAVPIMRQMATAKPMWPPKPG
jgi:hypothetical protein